MQDDLCGAAATLLSDDTGCLNGGSGKAFPNGTNEELEVGELTLLDDCI